MTGRQTPARAARMMCVAAFAIGALIALAAPLGAQDDGFALPTLESLGIGPWMNESGSIQFGLSGRADLDFYQTGDVETGLIAGTGSIVAPRVRLFGDLFVGDAWFVSTELRFDRGPMESLVGHEFRVEQAFVRWSPFTYAALQLGRFASPFGSYPSRHHTDDDWFIRPPVMYDHRTVVLTGRVPADADEWMAWKDSTELRERGVPPVWGAPYQWGGMAFGALRDLSWRVAYMNSAPASGPDQWDELGFESGSLVAAFGYRFAPWVRVEASYATGSFLERDLSEEQNPTIHGPGWFVQQIIGGELLFELAHTQLRAEAFHDTWTYVEDDAIDLSWSVEARQELFQDWFVAGRIGQMRFSDVEVPAALPSDIPRSEPWDYNVQRIQIAGGFRFASNAEIRAEYLTQTTDGPADPDDDVVALQLWWAF
ncbi:MAG TPA: hypothetical protein VF039_06890 [Longimicrobiales bacterium]